METADPIRILVVDDSRIFRDALQEALKGMAGVHVVGSVFSGEKALEWIDRHIQESPPDLITLDVEMPGIGGIATLQEIQKRNRDRRSLPPMETILVSALTQTGSRIAIEGLQLGAIDFLPKPTSADPVANQKELRTGLLQKIELIRQRRSGKWAARSSPSNPSSPLIHSGSAIRSAPTSSSSVPASGGGLVQWKRQAEGSRLRAIAFGTSTGGPEALNAILPSLAKNCSLPIFIVQHILDGLSQYLAESLTRRVGRPVFEAKDGMQVQPGGIYLARSGKHMIVRRFGDTIQIGVTEAPPERGCRPSVNVFFRSLAAVYGPDFVAAVLTGMGDDGAEGVRVLRRAGGTIVAQDEASCIVWGMPRAAVETGCVDHVIPLDRIAFTLERWVQESRPCS